MVIIPCFQVQFLDHGHVTAHRVLHPEVGATVPRMKVQWSISEVETPMPRFPQVASPQAILHRKYSTLFNMFSGIKLLTATSFHSFFPSFHFNCFTKTTMWQLGMIKQHPLTNFLHKHLDLCCFVSMTSFLDRPSCETPRHCQGSKPCNEAKPEMS